MNPHKGDITASLGGEDYTLRLTFEGLAAIEGALGVGIVSVAERFPARSVGTADVQAILSQALKGGGNAMDEAGLTQAIMQTGFVEATKLAGQVLAIGLGAAEGT